MVIVSINGIEAWVRTNPEGEFICRFCDQPVTDPVQVAGYWRGSFISHPDCKEQGRKNEAYECQKIDSNCNDCGHFQRGQKIDNGTWRGNCNKFGKDVKAHPGFASLLPCFVHRKDMNALAS